MSLTLNRAQLIGGLLGCTMLGSIAGNIALSFADGNNRTSSVLNGNFVLPYDGYLTLNSTPLNSPHQLKFDLYQNSSGTGQAIFTETQTVEFYNGRFSAAIGANSGSDLKTHILDAEKLYLKITVTQIDAMGAPIPNTTVELSGLQAIEAAPFAVWSGNASNLEVAQDVNVGRHLHVTENLTVDQTVHATAVNPEVIRPKYAAWNSYGVGDGGAAIYNDNAAYKSLMLIGNNSRDNNNRQVEVFDDLKVNQDLSTVRDALIGGSLTVTDNILGVETVHANAVNPLVIRPGYRNFASFGHGDGGASIYNDDNSYKALVIRGNNSADASKQRIEMYNEVAIGGTLHSDSHLSTGGNATVAGDLNVTGKINGFEITNEVSVSASSGDNDAGMGVTKTEGFCFLVGHGHNEFANGNNQDSSCYLDIDGATLEWELKAGATVGSTTCEARCVKF